MGADWKDFSLGGGRANLSETNMTSTAASWALLTPAWNGTSGWPFMTGDKIRCSPIRVSGKLLSGSDDHIFRAITISTGVLSWSFTAGGSIRTTACSDGTRVGFGSDDFSFYVRNVSDGSFVWTFATGGRVRGSPVLSGANVIFESEDGKVYCKNFTNGATVWTYNVATGSLLIQPLIIVGSSVIVSTQNGTALAVDTAAGTLTHTFQTGGAILGPPASIVDAAGLTHLIVGGDDHWWYNWQGVSPYSDIWRKHASGDESASGAAFSVVDDRVTLNEHNSSSQLRFLSTGEPRAKDDSSNTAGNSPLALQSTPCVAGTGVAGQQIMAVCMSAGDRRVKVRAMTNAPGGWDTIFKYPATPVVTNPFLYSSPIISQGQMFVNGEDGGIYGFG